MQSNKNKKSFSFDLFMQDLNKICKGINLNDYNILIDFLYLNAGVTEKSKWTSIPEPEDYDNPEPTEYNNPHCKTTSLRSQISVKAAKQLKTYYNEHFPQLNCRQNIELQEHGDIISLYMNTEALRKDILPLLADFLKKNPEIMEEYRRKSATPDDFMWARKNIFDNKGIDTYPKTYPKKDFDNCFDEILTELINEYHDDKLQPTSPLPLPIYTNEKPIKLENNNDKKTTSFTISDQAEKSVPKILSFFNHLHSNTAEYKSNEHIIRVHPVALMEDEFLNAVKYKADHLEPDTIDYYRKQSDMIKYTRNECIKMLAGAYATIKNEYPNTKLKHVLLYTLNKLALQLTQMHPDSDDQATKGALLQTIIDVRTAKENYLKEQDLSFPLMAIEQPPRRTFPGGKTQPPPKMVPDPRTPAIFNEITDVCQNLEDIMSKKYVIHSLSRGARYGIS